MVKRLFDKSPRKEREDLPVLYVVLKENLHSIDFIYISYLWKILKYISTVGVTFRFNN